MVDAVYLVICFFRRIELNYFSVFISFIITIPPTSIYISDGMLRILGTARVRLFDATHWRFVLRAAYRQQHGWRWQFDSTFRLGRNYLHHTEHAFETGDVFSFETWIISFLDWKKGTLDICLFYPETQCRRWYFSFVVTQFETGVFFFISLKKEKKKRDERVLLDFSTCCNFNIK